MTHTLLLFLLHSSGAGIQGQGAGWAPSGRVSRELQVAVLPLNPHFLMCWREL